MPVSVDYLGEGASDSAIARRLIMVVGGILGVNYLRPAIGTGKQSLDRRLKGLNKAARFGNPVLVLRDLDSASCAPALVSSLLPDRDPRLLLRICVRESEVWLMADAEAYARYSGVSIAHLPAVPEVLDDPKRALLDLAAGGHAKKLQRHLDDTRRRQVADYRALGQWHSEFATEHWDPERAAASNRAPSLTRALTRLRALIREG